MSYGAVVTNEWNDQVQRGIRKPSNVGIVVMNYEKSSVAMANAVSNRMPRFARDEGAKRDSFGDIKRGDVLWTYRDESCLGASGYSHPRDIANCADSGIFSPTDASSKTHLLAVVNGQGSRSDTQTTFMSKIRIVGVAEDDVAENRTLGTVVIGGMLPVRNNGPYQICDGDDIIAVPPDPNKKGLLKLEYQPYRHDLHRNAPKEIYQCLLDSVRLVPGASIHDSMPYLPAYRKHARHVMDGTLGASALVIYENWKLLSKMTQASPNQPTPSQLTHFLTVNGHSEFGQNAAIPRPLLDRLFVPFSRSDGKGSTPFLYEHETANNEQKKLNKVQAESMGKYFSSSAYFMEEILSCRMGCATSAAKQGDWFTLHLTDYTR